MKFKKEHFNLALFSTLAGRGHLRVVFRTGILYLSCYAYSLTFGEQGWSYFIQCILPIFLKETAAKVTRKKAATLRLEFAFGLESQLYTAFFYFSSCDHS